MTNSKSTQVQQGAIRGGEPFVVEAVIDEITFSKLGSPIVMKLRKENYDSVVLYFHKVDRVRGINLSESNIIDRISAWPGKDGKESFIKELVWLNTGNYEESYSDEYELLINSQMQKLKDKDLTLYQIEPVSGLEIMILCSSATWACR